MNDVEVLDPAGQVQQQAPLQCNPIGPLAGVRLAILDNSKPNFRRLATLVGEKLQRDAAVGGITHYRKENAAVGAGATLLDEIAGAADLVLTGSAD